MKGNKYRAKRGRGEGRQGGGEGWNNEWILGSDSDDFDESSNGYNDARYNDSDCDNNDINDNISYKNFANKNNSPKNIPRKLPCDLLSLTVQNLPRVVQECLDRFDLPSCSLTDLVKELDLSRKCMMIMILLYYN